MKINTAWQTMNLDNKYSVSLYLRNGISVCKDTKHSGHLYRDDEGRASRGNICLFKSWWQDFDAGGTRNRNRRRKNMSGIPGMGQPCRAVFTYSVPHRGRENYKSMAGYHARLWRVGITFLWKRDFRYREKDHIFGRKAGRIHIL